MSKIQFKDTANHNRDIRYIKSIMPKLKKIGRAPLILGKRLKITPTGKKEIGPQFYIPSQDEKNIENLFNYGMSGSGKTWGMFNLIGQSFFFERRCWVIIDSKGSYRGNHLPNKEFESELKSFGLKPRGIPKELMVVCAPEYYTAGMTPEEIRRDQITNKYRIPISMANIQILFAMTKLNPDTMYSSSYDMSWKRMMARTNRKPTKNDLYDMLNTIIAEAPQAMSRWYDTLANKIQDVEDLILSEKPFSPVGRALLRSAYDGLPRWIVVTFKRSDNSKDEVNLAIYAAVLEEIRRVTEIVKDNGLDLRTGLWVDELQYYASDKNTIAFSATRDAIYWWGRSNQLFRIWGTQTNRHLDKLLRDNIGDKTKEGTYQKVIRFVRKGGPGYCSYMDRQLENAFNLNVPYFVPLIKSPPPMFRIIE